MSNPLEYMEFNVSVYIENGEQFIEAGQTLQTLPETIKFYQENYRVESVEIYTQKNGIQDCIEIAYNNPF